MGHDNNSDGGSLDGEQALSPKQFCKLIGISPVTAAQWRMCGKGPRFFRAGRSIRYLVSDIRAWRESRSAGRSRAAQCGSV